MHISLSPIDRASLVATTPFQSVPARYGDEGVLLIPLSSSITGASSADCLVLYPGESFWRILSLYSEAAGVFYSPRRLSNMLSLSSTLTITLW